MENEMVVVDGDYCMTVMFSAHIFGGEGGLIHT